MIIVRLMGGLGNQMFQYAAGKALAERLGLPLQLDRTFLDYRSDNPGYTLRNFELDVFRIEASIAPKSDVARLRRPFENGFQRRISRYFPNLFPNHIFYENQKKYIPAFETLKDPVYMEGYWQTEKYFHSIAKTLRKKYFIPVAPITGLNAELMKSIESKNSASLHVRRGDYITSESANKFHGTCSIDYYERSAKMLVEQKDVDHFFIFSDEPNWVKENIKLPYPTTIISHNIGRDSYWDLHLMRHCKHHITANSSFSWWGAWLNPDPNKMVIAPKNWFTDPNSAENEIIPTEWIKN